MSATDHAAFWSQRYAGVGDDFLFGTEPCHFLLDQAGLFEPGLSALSLADGEGRNAVWLAQRGLEVTAIEISPVALSKARGLADRFAQHITFHQGDLLDPASLAPVLDRTYDRVLGIFIQFADASEQPGVFATMKRATAPGGRVVLLGYTPQQLEYRTGGPPTLENLYTEALLRQHFADWDIEWLQAYEREIAEGSGHRGRSALIGLVARRPEA